MPKRKRLNTPSSDADSSYKQESTDDEIPVLRTRSKRARASTPPKAIPVIKNPAETEQRSPGKLLAALNNLTNPPITLNHINVPSTPGLRAPASNSAPTSPRKSAPSSPRKSKPPVKPEAEWRASDIPPEVKITKTFAQKLFRLTAADINDSQLRCQRKNRVRAKGFMLLYSMRDIERLAWKKHGGPEGFDHKLERDKELWISRGKDPIAFPRVPRPFSHFKNNKCIQCKGIFSISSSILEEKCDTCRGVTRTRVGPGYGVYIADIGDIMGLAEDALDYGEDYGEDYAEDNEHEYGHSCPTCDFFGISCNDE